MTNGRQTGIMVVYGCLASPIIKKENIAMEQKSKLAAGLLGIFLGGFGVHRFYLGYTKMGVIQIIVTLVTCGAGSLWGFIEGILILCGTYITTDANGNPLSDE